MSKWYEWGPLDLTTLSLDTTGVDVSSMSLSSPSITSETTYEYDEDDKSESLLDITTGTGSITTSIYTPPLMQPAATNKVYKLVTLLSDSGQTRVLVGWIKSGDT